MKICEYCNIEHNGLYASGRFCSQTCSRKYSSNINRKIKNKKISVSIKNIHNTSPEVFKNLRSPETIQKIKAKKQEKEKEKNFQDLSFDRKRQKVIESQDNSCNICDIKLWQNTPIILELDHIDGNRNNNDRDNLRALCPNCHSQTITWRGKNKKTCKRSDEELIEVLTKTRKIRQTLIHFGMAPKGGNYKRINSLIEKYKIDVIKYKTPESKSQLLSNESVIQIRSLFEKGETIKDLVKIYSLNRKTIYDIVYKNTYKNI